MSCFIFTIKNQFARMSIRFRQNAHTTDKEHYNFGLITLASHTTTRGWWGAMRRGRGGGGGGWKFYRNLLAAGNRLGARNDRGITNGAKRRKGAKKGGAACQRNNAADAKANKMPSGVAPINHYVRTYHLPFGLRRAAPMHSINKTCGAKRSARCIDWYYQINVV